MAEEPSLSYYLPIAGGENYWIHTFPGVLVLCEMQSVSSRIWTRIAVLISYGDNDYTTGTSIRDGWLVGEQLLLCQVLPLGLVKYCSQHSCVVAVKLFLYTFR